MAVVYITEYGDLRAGAAYEPRVGNHVLTTSGTSAAVTVGANAAFLRVHTDGVISYNFGGAATTAMSRMGLDQTEYFNVRPGVTFNAITNT